MNPHDHLISDDEFFLPDVPEGFQAGFVGIIGMPNVGKSTLLNHLVGEKVAIVSPKPQTTRSRVRGIANREMHQIIYLDTPGLQDGKSALDVNMRRLSLGTLEEVDVILFVVDATCAMRSAEPEVLEMLQKVSTPVILVLNKVDRAKPEQIGEALTYFGSNLNCAEYIPISAKNGFQVEILEKAILAHLPQNPPLYPRDQVSTQPESFLISELAREKILVLAKQEVPHCAAVLVEHREYREDKELYIIHAKIIVERDSQKKILVGHRGQMIREIGVQTRQEIEALLGVKIYLELIVTVKPNWRNDPNIIQQLGYIEQ